MTVSSTAAAESAATPTPSRSWLASLAHWLGIADLTGAIPDEHG